MTMNNSCPIRTECIAKLPSLNVQAELLAHENLDQKVKVSLIIWLQLILIFY